MWGAVMIGRIITGDDCVTEGAAWLAQAEPRFGQALILTGPLPLRRKADGFAALLDAIVGQQVSTQSAAAIWKRLEAAGLTEEGAVLAATEEDLRACGLSRQKIRYAHALAQDAELLLARGGHVVALKDDAAGGRLFQQIDRAQQREIGRAHV